MRKARATLPSYLKYHVLCLSFLIGSCRCGEELTYVIHREFKFMIFKTMACTGNDVKTSILIEFDSLTGIIKRDNVVCITLHYKHWAFEFGYLLKDLYITNLFKETSAEVYTPEMCCIWYILHLRVTSCPVLWYAKSREDKYSLMYEIWQLC